MSGLANMLIDAGAIMSGSEPEPGPLTFEFIRKGAKISRTRLGNCSIPEIDLVVRTAAVPDKNREMVAASQHGSENDQICPNARDGDGGAFWRGRRRHARQIHHQRDDQLRAAQCGVDPSFVIGGTVPQLGGGSHSGSGNIFVAEACEFDRSFHNLRPRVAHDHQHREDHLDYYKDIDEIIDSFRDFARRVPRDGLIIAGGRDRHIAAGAERIGDAD